MTLMETEVEHKGSLDLYDDRSLVMCNFCQYYYEKRPEMCEALKWPLKAFR